MFGLKIPSGRELSLDLFDAGLQAGHLVLESQMVALYRTCGMIGLVPFSARERTAMVAEKPTAFAASAMAAGIAAMEGRRPDQVLSAAVHPLRAKTHENSRRVGRMG